MAVFRDIDVDVAIPFADFPQGVQHTARINFTPPQVALRRRIDRCFIPVLNPDAFLRRRSRAAVIVENFGFPFAIVCNIESIVDIQPQEIDFSFRQGQRILKPNIGSVDPIFIQPWKQCARQLALDRSVQNQLVVKQIGDHPDPLGILRLRCDLDVAAVMHNPDSPVLM